MPGKSGQVGQGILRPQTLKQRAGAEVEDVRPLTCRQPRLDDVVSVGTPVRCLMSKVTSGCAAVCAAVTASIEEMVSAVLSMRMLSVTSALAKPEVRAIAATREALKRKVYMVGLLPEFVLGRQVVRSSGRRSSPAAHRVTAATRPCSTPID